MIGAALQVLFTHGFVLVVGVIVGYWAREIEVREERRKREARLRAANRK